MTRALWLELAALTLLAAAAGAAVPLGAGYLQWSWDALNHHVYLGMIAETPRWHLDVMPASFQTYQYPYLYWPVYRMSLLTGSGAWIGAAWSASQAALLLPPVWLIAHRLLPAGDNARVARLERVAACAFAAMSAIVLIGVETTSNDLLAAVPLLWALAVAAKSPLTDRGATLAALLLGVSVAFKLSNALFVPVLALWWWVPARPWLPLRRGLAMGVAVTLGFVLAYAPWGWQLWQLTGNPFYPMLQSIFGAR